MIFLNSASSAAALVFYLSGACTHTDTEGKQSSEYFFKNLKNTIFNEQFHEAYFEAYLMDKIFCLIFSACLTFKANALNI